MHVLHRGAFALSFALAAAAAHSADVPQGMLDANTNVCMQMARTPSASKLDPLLPSDASKVAGYCACVSKTYWASVPQADFDGMMAEHRQMADAAQTGAAPRQGAHGKAITDVLHTRMAEARKTCH
jgi:hypothetical protein